MSETIKKEKEPNTNIPKKNYVRVCAIYIVTFLLLFLFIFAYDTYHKYQNSIAILQDVTIELNVENFENYLVENDDFLVYIGVPSNQESRRIEKGLLSVIEQYRLQNKIIYLNVEDGFEKFKNSFNETYQTSLENYPAFIIYQNGEVLSLLQSTSSTKLTSSDIAQALDENEVIVKE